MRAVRIVVSGRVQGVGFRAFVQRLADELGVTGWVRNRADGSVEAEAVGREPELVRFVEALRAGPRHARVEHADEEWFESAGAPRGFRVTE
jgi:acylphosphatase